jgi:hypothetical protein
MYVLLHMSRQVMLTRKGDERVLSWELRRIARKSALIASQKDSERGALENPMLTARTMRHVVVALGVGVILLACGSKRDGFTDQDPTLAADGGSGPGLGGAAACKKGGHTCVGNDVYDCADDGKLGALVKSCDDSGTFCLGGECQSGCAAAANQPSNVGCEFWAVDLDNEYSTVNDAAGQPWGVVVSNFGDSPADVTIATNTAVVKTATLAPGTLQEIELPTREVDGSVKGQDDGPGTFVSPNAFKITSTQPIVVYQFNTMRLSYSNDASLLVPVEALGNVYRILGWPTANPISAGFTIPGIPDHSYVTIVGTQPSTHVKVRLGGAIVGGGGIPATPKGGVVEYDLGPFDVLNLESDGIPGDMSGTIVESSLPVAVFTGGERGIAPMDDKAPAPPGFDKSNLCCTDHLEEQMLPVTSYGKQFVVSRSPIRSDGGYVEPDILRFMGVAAEAHVKTSLPPPDDSFVLTPGQIHDAYTTTDITVDSTEPVAIAQILVSQTFTTKYTGDPSLTIYPPVDQYRRDYLFNVPTSYDSDYVVISAPVGTNVSIDAAVPTGCVVAPAGNVAGKDWEARRCPVSVGAHRMHGDAPFGIVAYGYGSRASYAFIGGANVKKIYTPPPLN